MGCFKVCATCAGKQAGLQWSQQEHRPIASLHSASTSSFQHNTCHIPAPACQPQPAWLDSVGHSDGRGCYGTQDGCHRKCACTDPCSLVRTSVVKPPDEAMQLVAGAAQKVANRGEKKACHCPGHVDVERPATYRPHHGLMDDGVQPLLKFCNNMLQEPQLYVVM